MFVVYISDSNCLMSEIIESQPIVSVIVPVYKVEKCLHRCIDSILAQTVSDIEVILVDDGSPDNSGVICDEYAEKDCRVRVIHKPNGGVSSARNAGIEIAYGEWLCFVDSDDYVIPSYLESFEINNISADIYLQGYVKKKDDDIIEQHNFSACACRDFFSILAYSEDNYILNSPCFKLFNNNIVKKYNLFFDVNTSYGEDHLFTLSYIQKISSAHYSLGEGYVYCLSDTESLTQRIVPYEEITYYSLTAKKLYDTICKRTEGAILLPSVGLSFMTNYIRTLKYLSKSDYSFHAFKWVRDRFKDSMKNISTTSIPKKYQLLRLLTISQFYYIIYPYIITLHKEK